MLSIVEFDVLLICCLQLAPAIDDPNTCALCEFVINELEQKLTENKTEESIKFALENVCEFLPKSIRKDCVRLIDAYTEQIVEMFLADLTPDEVCTALKLCKPKVVKGWLHTNKSIYLRGVMSF